MLDASNLASKQTIMPKGIGLPVENINVGMQEQGAATLADIAFENDEMQEAIIDSGGIPYLLNVMRTGSQLGQEHAARVLRNLAMETENQNALVDANTIPELVQLTKTGSARAQEVAAAGLSELASGAIVEREKKRLLEEVFGKTAEYDEDDPLYTAPRPDRLVLIAEAGGIVPLVAMMLSPNSFARENAAGALMHLALEPANQIAIAKANGIAPLVAILDDGTETAHGNAAKALLRLAVNNEDNQGQTAKHLVALLSSEKEGAQMRAAQVMSQLAKYNPGSPVTIVNAGAISPLVNLLSGGTLAAKAEASNALKNLSLNSPSTQLAIARGLVVLLETGSPESQEHLTQLLLTLAADTENRSAISKAGAIPRLVMQLRDKDTSVTAQELTAAVLAQLSRDSVQNADAVAAASGVKPLVAMLLAESAIAQAHAASVLSDLARRSMVNQAEILEEHGIAPLVALLAKEKLPKARAEGAGALMSLSQGQPETQRLVAESGAIKLLVALLHDDDDYTRKKASGAIAALCEGSAENQDAVERNKGIAQLVSLLADDNGGSNEQEKGSKMKSGAWGKLKKLVPTKTKMLDDAVRAEAAAALAVLTRGNRTNQDKVSAVDGIKPLVAMLHAERSVHAKEEAAGALWSLAASHFDNQTAIADAGGIAPLVAVLGLDSVRAQRQAGNALAALALDNTLNQSSIAKLMVSLLGSSDRHIPAKAARAISHLARANAANQVSLAQAGGVTLLVKLLETADSTAPAAKSQPSRHALSRQPTLARLATHLAGQEGAAESSRSHRGHRSNRSNRSNHSNRTPSRTPNRTPYGSPDRTPQSSFREGKETRKSKAASPEAVGPALVKKEMAAAIWSMAANNPANQDAVAQSGGIELLIGMLGVAPQVQRDVAGALWSLAGNPGNAANQAKIAKKGGIEPLVSLLRTGGADSQETVAGALFALAEMADNRVAIANAGGIPLLVNLVASASEEAIEQAAGALQNLAQSNPDNQRDIAQGLVRELSKGSVATCEHVTTLLRNLAHDPKNRSAIAKAGAVPELVRQLECGSEKSMGMAASALALIALKSAEHRATVTKELVKLLGSTNESVRQRASEALRDMAAEEKPGAQKQKRGGPSSAGDAQQSLGLVNLLKDGLKDGNVEAQEYALRSLSNISDTASKEMVVSSGGIICLISSLESGLLSTIAQEHAASVLSGLAAARGENALAIRDAEGIAALVLLLSRGNVEAKEHAANTLAHLARQAAAGNLIAEAGGVSAFVTWLADPKLGPPEVAARALSEIALDNPDAQAQIAEEGAISSLIAMLQVPQGTSAAPLRRATVAAGTLATIAKDNLVNQIMITEEEGIPPLLLLLSDQMKSAHENATKALWHLAKNEDNQSAIPRAGGIEPLVALLSMGSAITQQYTAAALESLALDHVDNQIALAKAGAIELLVELLGSESPETQKHAVGALLSLGANDEESRNAVVKANVGVLDVRNAAAQMKACEALAVLAARSAENRKAITACEAIAPLVRLLGDGRRVRTETPQERAAAVLADLARLGENRLSIVKEGGAQALVAMLSADSGQAQTHAAATLSHIASVAINKQTVADAGAIQPLVALLSKGSFEARKFAMGALWHLASSADNKTAMASAGAIPLLVAHLSSDSSDAREHAAAVLSTLARTQGGNKKAIVKAVCLRHSV